MGTKVRVWTINDLDLPDELHTVRDVFSQPSIKKVEAPKPPVEENPRGPREGLHDYLTRKGIQCFCKPCRSKRERDNNSTLVLDSPTDSNS